MEFLQHPSRTPVLTTNADGKPGLRQGSRDLPPLPVDSHKFCPRSVAPIARNLLTRPPHNAGRVESRPNLENRKLFPLHLRPLQKLGKSCSLSTIRMFEEPVPTSHVHHYFALAKSAFRDLGGVFQAHGRRVYAFSAGNSGLFDKLNRRKQRIAGARCQALQRMIRPLRCKDSILGKSISLKHVVNV